MYYTQTQTLEDKQNLLEEKNAKKVQLKDVENTLKKLETAQNDLSRKVALIGQLKSKKLSTVRMMDEVSNALPEWVWLSSLSFSGSHLNLNGKAIHNNLIADFINNLKATDSFTNIRFEGSTKQKQAGVPVFNFKINCIYRAKPTDKNKSKKVG